MSNDEIAELFKWYADLSELHNGNPFKIKSYAAAAFKIDKITTPLETLGIEELEKLEGIGKSIALKIDEINKTGTFPELVEVINATPTGVIELFKVKGIGPKKIAYIWQQLGIESIGELLYACNENRLAQAKGFGVKTQQSVKESIEFIFSNANKFHFAKVETFANALVQAIDQSGIVQRISLTGAIRRKSEVLEKIELVASCSHPENLVTFLKNLENIADVSLSEKLIQCKLNQNIPVHIVCCDESSFTQILFTTTATPSHLESLEQLGANLNQNEENAIYASVGLSFIAPEMREGLNEIEKAKSGNLPKLIELSDLTGILHNHTTYSDGANTLAEMAGYCKELGYQYLGICDHSKSAQYAGGLSEEEIIKQHTEIDALNKKLAPFTVFKGIESDILGDGSLDYSNEVLSTFDFVVASIHSNLKMSEEKAMSRLLKAIENPYTTILGHPTGRLLLMREGYPVDHKKMIDACAANGVVIEINANPYRLDLDWRWIDYALNKNVMLSINPDAHETAGYHDMYYGVCVARKGGLNKDMCFNALPLEQIKAHFQGRRK